MQWNWLALYFLKWNTAISDIFFFNPIFPKFFSIRFSLGGGRHISCHVKLYTKVIDLKNPSKWSKGKHSWVWILNLWVQISETPTIFQLKTSITEKVAEAQGCKHYQQGQYENCLQWEIQRKFIKTIKCIPPWFSKEYKQVHEDMAIIEFFNCFILTERAVEPWGF